MQNFLKHSCLDPLAENFNSGCIVVTINFATHQALSLRLMEQSKAVRSFDEWPRVDLVVRANNCRDSFRICIDGRKAEPVSEFRMAAVVPPQRFDAPRDALDLNAVRFGRGI